jgi:hypothetical protein
MSMMTASRSVRATSVAGLTAGPEIVDDDINALIVAIRYDRGRPASFSRPLSTHRTGNSINLPRTVPAVAGEFSPPAVVPRGEPLILVVLPPVRDAF